MSNVVVCRFDRLISCLVLPAAVALGGCSGEDGTPKAGAGGEAGASGAHDVGGVDDAGGGLDAGGTGEGGAGGTETTPTVEPISWRPCGELECGSIAVPIDPSTPSLGSLRVAVNVHRATKPDQRIGYLLVNPGGPGASGRQMLREGFAASVPELAERFDIVGFDPRGVNVSEPRFECGEGNAQSEVLANVSLPIDDSDEGYFADALDLCAASMGEAAGRLGSYFVAQDMDAIRRALGVEQISYLGYSYGSSLGTWYASLFPSHVRAMVVDGAPEVVPSARTAQERVEAKLNESAQFERKLQEALAACQDSTCPIFSGGGPLVAYEAAMANKGLVQEAMPGVSNPTLQGVALTLYDSERYPYLWVGLAGLAAGDPTVIVQLAKFYGAVPGPSFLDHVNCLDDWAIRPELTQQDRIQDSNAFVALAPQRLPLLTAALSGGSADVPCAFFGEILPRLPPFQLDGGGVPVVVVGNQSDPATPFAESQRLATDVLSNGYLIETDHHGHTVFPENSCVKALVDDVLLEQRLPAERRTVCPREDE